MFSKLLVGMITLLVTATALAFQGYDGSTSVGIFSQIKCGTGITCSKSGYKMQIAPSASYAANLSGDGAHTLAGFLNNEIAATSVSISAAQCGSTFVNTAAVVLGLPPASTSQGCRLTFVVGGAAASLAINPTGTDRLLLLTDANGDASSYSTLGGSLVIQAINATQWVTISSVGAWTDIN